jgi:hypothetical protein
MGELHPKPLLCERTRAWVSAAQDGELSEFERALIAAHLERCAECRVFADDVASITEALRTSPLESPAHPITLPARRRRAGASAIRIGGVAAVLVGALGLAGSLSLTVPSDTSPEVPIVVSGVPDDFDEDLRSLRRDDLLPPRPPPDLSRKSLSLP